jgi:PAS domain S-box-containing protein
MENPYRNYFQNMPGYLAVVDRSFRIVETNRNLEQDFGNIKGRHCYKAYRNRDEKCLGCPVEETFIDGKVHSGEEHLALPDGREVSLIVHTTPIFNESGEVESVMEVSTDITPIRKLQSQLESLGLLIGTISHSIKGLCTGLDGGIYLVNSGKEHNDQSRMDKGWNMVQRNANRIRRQVTNILYYAKERTPDWETLSSTEIVKETVGILSAKAKRLNIGLTEAYRDSAETFEGDHQAVRSALVNLLENSLDACDADKLKTIHHVTLSTSGDDESVTFEIKDNGIGMDAETREKAVSLFFSSKGALGTGLGLFVANRIAAAHGGTLHIDSEPDLGAAISVRLPRKRPEVLSSRGD